MADYLDTAAVAAILKVRPQSVTRYRHHDRKPKFPAPDLVLSGRPGWLQVTIEEWIKHRPGRGVGGGRPRKYKEDGDGEASR